MKDPLKHQPKPEIENHYHIQDLINRQQARSEDKTRHKDIDKKRDEVLKDIAGFKDIELLDFYCKHCKRDFKGRAKKQIDNWSTIAYYKIKHICGNWCIRHITDRVRDPYFYYSKNVARDRGEATLDTLQSFETGYNMVYKK